MAYFIPVWLAITGTVVHFSYFVFAFLLLFPKCPAIILRPPKADNYLVRYLNRIYTLI